MFMFSGGGGGGGCEIIYKIIFNALLVEESLQTVDF